MSKKTLNRLIIFAILFIFSLVLFFFRNGDKIWNDYRYDRLPSTDLSQITIDSDRLGDIVTKNRGLHREVDGISRTVDKTGVVTMIMTRDGNKVLVGDQLLLDKTITSQNLENQLKHLLGDNFVYEYKTYTYMDRENNIVFEIRDDYKNGEFVFTLNKYDTFISLYSGTEDGLISREWKQISRYTLKYILLSVLIAPLTIFTSDYMTLTTTLLIAPTLTPLIWVFIPSTRYSSKLKNKGVIIFYIISFVSGLLLILVALTAP